MYHVPRSAYYRWIKDPGSYKERMNQKIADTIKKIHEEHPDMGYRRLKDELEKKHDIKANDKRVLRICRKTHIQSTIKWRPKSCTRGSKDPAYIAKNYLNRDFHADAPNQKWLTDVSEFKYYVGIEVRKVYLSAILDLYDRRIVSFVISDRNDNQLVMDTFDSAVAKEPDAHPLFHSDRGFQYTSAMFSTRLKKHHMKHFTGWWLFSFPISLRKFRLSVQERMFPDRSKSCPNGPHTSAKKFRVPLLKQTGNVL